MPKRTMDSGRSSNESAHRSWWAPLLILFLTPVYYLVPWKDLAGFNVFLGVPFVFVYTVLLPGVILQERLRPRHTDVLDTFAGASMFGLSYFLIVTFAWALTGTPLGLFQLLLPVAVVLVTALRFVPRKTNLQTDSVPPNPIDGLLTIGFAAVVVAVFLLVLRSGVPIGFTADTLDHIGYVAEIRDTQSAFPTTAFYAEPGPYGEDLRKALLHVFYGFGSSYLNIEPLDFLNVTNAIFAALLVLVVYSTGLLFFQNRIIAILSAVFFLVALDEGLGGTMVRQSFYSHRFGFAFFLCVLAHGLGFLERGNRRELLPTGLFAFAACATHVFFGLLVGFATATVLVWKVCFPQNEWRAHVAKTLQLGAVLFAGVLPFGLYRFLTAFPEPNELHAEVQGVVFLTRHLYIAEPINVYRWFGPIGVLSLLTMIPLWKYREKYAALGYVFASFLTILIVLFNPILLPPLRNAMTYLIARLNNLCPFYLATACFLTVFFSPDHPENRRGVFRIVLVVLLAIAVLGGLRPVLGENTFSREVIQRERDNSYLRWKDELAEIKRSLGSGAVIASDPLTAYSVTAFTPHYVVCTFDQHAPPNDVLLEERMRAARDILSPYVPIDRTLALLGKHKTTHIILNNRFPGGLVLEYWVMNDMIFPAIREKFDSHPRLFTKVFDRDDFAVLEVKTVPVVADTSLATPFVLDVLPRNYVPLGQPSGEATLDGYLLGGTPATRGGVIDVGLVWSGERSERMRNYIVALRFDHTDPRLPLGGKPFPKIVRKAKEKLTGRRYRFTEHHKIRGGFLSPDTWRPGALILDETRVRVPLDVVPGEYIVSAKLLSVKHQPTYWLRDFFFDDDIYQGVPIQSITIE
ncbi:MAG: hypothetical protein JSW58_02650 [Candidatus Latescibacterota bacterium]|nr:MAG: hypothetical protein JSW58_02650 [Candidatus Latescibacterota bacterium]